MVMPADEFIVMSWGKACSVGGEVRNTFEHYSSLLIQLEWLCVFCI